MPQIAQLIGGPGTGKTSELLNIMDGVVERLHDPHLCGFVSFTRAACDEAADRAADRFNMTRASLRQHGWFKTLHGVCYRALGIGEELLTDNAASRKWVEEAMQEPLEGNRETEDLSDGLDVFAQTDSEAGRALALWGTARNRLEPLRPTWEEADQCDTRTPDYARCVELIDRYEQAKLVEGRMDFTDILLRFAGYWPHVDGPSRCQPRGEVPGLPAWIHDEMQDSSRLLDACFRRLIEHPECKWVYLGGDPWQSIYRWGGADHRCFLDYPTAKRRVMPKSWRCPAEILRLGESILSECSGYWDRGIAPAGPGGDIDEAHLGNGWADDVDPRESWLILARTNYQAARLAKRLDDLGVPWLPTKKDRSCFWKAPVRNAALAALLSLEAGAPIDGSQWLAILKHLPSTAEGVRLLRHGIKTELSDLDNESAQDRWPLIFPSGLDELGATEGLVEALASKRWRQWVEGADRYAEAMDRWGREVVEAPKVRLGSIHSAKGLESDNVAILTTISAPVFNSAQSEEGGDEEARVKYVAVTRARKRLVIVRERRSAFAWRLDE